MEQRAYQKWTRGLLLGLVLVLTACAAVVYRVDPCFYYRMPTDREPVFFSERYQTAGIVRNNPADVVLLGSSMTANCYGSQLETVFGDTGLRLTIPDGYFSEFDQVMGLLMRTHPPKRVLFAMDTNIFTRSPDGVTGAMPDYLYDASTINDVKYLLNKDVLYYSLYALMAQRWDEGETLDKGFSWMDTVWWNHMTALEEYTRPDIAPEPMPRDGLLADAAKNLAVAASWAERYPEVEFDFYFSPYSILYWDKIGRMGETDAVFAALELACETLLPYENVTLHGLLFDRDIIEHLDYYCDYVHHSDEAGALALEKIHSGTDRLTEKNYRETLANWHDFVVNYDYDKFWDDYYWYQFHTPAGAKTRPFHMKPENPSLGTFAYGGFFYDQAIQYPKFLHHCSHRPRQVHFGGPAAGDLRRRFPAPDGKSAFRQHGSGAGAGHHHQGPCREAELQGSGRRDL